MVYRRFIFIIIVAITCSFDTHGTIDEYLFTGPFGVTRQIFTPHTDPLQCITSDSALGIVDSDLFLQPDPTTYKFFSNYTKEQNNIVLCELYKDRETVHKLDTRSILKNTIKTLHEYGYQAYVGAELEFYLVKDFSDNSYPGAYCNILCDQNYKQLINELADKLVQADIIFTKFHKEYSEKQYEITLQHIDPLQLADNIILAKYLIKTCAQKYELQAIFMPKPFQHVSGNGFHFHISLQKNSTPIFYDTAQEGYLSKAGQQFVAGILQNISDFAIITNSTVNSYKRISGKFAAPRYTSWGIHNKSSMIRIPAFTNDYEARIEVRIADMLCNPYLTIALLLKSGLEGIIQKLTPPEPDTKAYEIKTNNPFPSSLQEALNRFLNSDFITEHINKELIYAISKMKMFELQEYNTTITDWEINQYVRYFQ